MLKLKTTIPTSSKDKDKTDKAVKTLPEFQQKIAVGNKAPILPAEDIDIKKRHRRTRAEIEAEGKLSETPDDTTGYEIVVDLLKAQSDMDTKKYGLPVADKEIFVPFSQNTMKIMNYFIGRYAKAWHYLLGVTLFQGYTLLSMRRALILQYAPKKPEAKPVIQPAAAPRAPEIVLNVPENRRPEDIPK